MLTAMILQHLLETGQTPLSHSAHVEKLCLRAEEILRYRSRDVGLMSRSSGPCTLLYSFQLVLRFAEKCFFTKCSISVL